MKSFAFARYAAFGGYINAPCDDSRKARKSRSIPHSEFRIPNYLILPLFSSYPCAFDERSDDPQKLFEIFFFVSGKEVFFYEVAAVFELLDIVSFCAVYELAYLTVVLNS